MSPYFKTPQEVPVTDGSYDLLKLDMQLKYLYTPRGLAISSRNLTLRETLGRVPKAFQGPQKHSWHFN